MNGAGVLADAGSGSVGAVGATGECLFGTLRLGRAVGCRSE